MTPRRPVPIIRSSRAAEAHPTYRLPARHPVQGYAVGLGLTTECNLSCSHCYRDPSDISRLTLAHIVRAQATDVVTETAPSAQGAH